MTSMFGNLPAHEKQAFFSMLDEYFETRPHLIGGQYGDSEGAASSTTYTQPLSAPAPAPRRANPPPAPAARKPISPMPSSSAARNTGPSPPAGVVSGKSFGSMNTSSAGAAFGSLLKSNQNSKNPITPGEAVSGLHAMTSAANRLNLSQQKRAPAPPPAPSPPQAVSSLGQAEVLYEYKGSDAEDLSVRKFEIISLIEKVNDDWWKAETMDGSRRSGLVPATYVQQL